MPDQMLVAHPLAVPAQVGLCPLGDKRPVAATANPARARMVQRTVGTCSSRDCTHKRGRKPSY